MLALIIAATLTAPAGCQERCATDANRCYSGCSGSAQCSRRCDDRTSDCNARCAKDQAKAETDSRAKTPSMPCDMRPGRNGTRGELHPCSETEAKVLREALNSPEARKTLKCKNSKGLPIPCKDELDRADDIVRAAGPDPICRDANGVPSLCPEAQKRIQKAAKP